MMLVLCPVKFLVQNNRYRCRIVAKTEDVVKSSQDEQGSGSSIQRVVYPKTL